MNKIRPFLCAALSALLLTALTAPVSAAEEDTMLQFDENGEFRILIVADTQDTATPQEATLRLLNAELDAADADLVVFTGDQVHGPSVRTEAAMEKALDAILAPVAERGIPFAAVFGNHDDEGGVSKETQLAIYQSYPGCLMSAGPDDITGCGNYNLLVWSSDGSRPVCNLWFLDSGTYGEKGVSKYARVEQDQIDWYTSTAAALEEQYGEMLPAYLFQHIIVPEIYDLLTEVPASEKKAEGVVKVFSSHSGHYYKMGDGFTAGHLGEAPCPPDIPSGEFAAMRDTGDVVAAFFGHDHKNDFVGTYEGIDLVNTAGTGFYIYGEREYHGARLVILHESTPAEYDTEMLYYKDLVSEPLPGGLTPIHGKYVENIVIAAAAGLLVLIGAGVYAGVRLSRRRKRGQKQ